MAKTKKKKEEDNNNETHSKIIEQRKSEKCLSAKNI